LHAGFAADAPVAVEIDYPVIPPEKSSHRADRYARSVIAVVAPEYREESPSVRVFALLYVLDPGAKRAKRNFVLGFAGDGTSVAADAFPMVYDKAVFHLVEASSIDAVCVNSFGCRSHGTRTKVYATSG
jgi:hypothetical protein